MVSLQVVNQTCMLYRFLKFIIGYAVELYFKEVQLRNEDRVPPSGPVIFLPNHRSAFMDPIVVAVFLNRKVHFLARGESFKNPVMANILGKLNVIPIYRKEYSPDEIHKNDEIFKLCFGLLEQQGALVIFPEGASQTKPVLLPLKTGAARIALGAEAKNDFKLGVTLVPVGINYTNPHHFQGKLFLNFGQSMVAADYKSQYENDPIEASHSLTKHIEEELKRRIVVVDESRWYDLTDKVEQIVHSDINRFIENKNLEHSEWYMARKDIAGAIDYFRKEKQEILEGIELRVKQYFSIIDILNLNEESLNPLGKKQKSRWKFLQPIYFGFGFPLFLIGFVLHFLPFYLTNFLSRLVVKRSDFIGSITLVIGLLLFSINGFLFTCWVYKLTNLITAVIFFFLLAPLGLFSFRYLAKLKARWNQLQLWLSGNRKKILIKKLAEDKEELLKIFKSAHDDYLVKEQSK